jgi:predicted O-methyltransferase YrrM
MLNPAILSRLNAIGEFYQAATALSSVPGWLHDLEGYALMTLAAHDTCEGAVVEIGSFKGRSTCWIAAGLKLRAAAAAKPSVVHAIDHFTGSPEHQPGGTHPDPDIAAHGSTLPAFRANVARLGLGQFVEPIVAPSLKAAPAWTKGPIRLLFIDGDHSYDASRADFEAWKSHLAPGALVGFHDVNSWEGVTRYYQELLNTDRSLREVAAINSLRIIRTPA